MAISLLLSSRSFTTGASGSPGLLSSCSLITISLHITIILTMALMSIYISTSTMHTGVSVLLSVSLASLTVVISKPLEDFLRSSFATKGFYFFQDPTKPVEELTLTETAGWQKLRKDDKWAGQMTQTRVLKGASEYALSLFYAIIGLGCQLQDLPKVGGKVLLLMFSTLAVHLSVLVISCRGWNRLIGNKLKLKVDVDTQIMASNACVGGPATAAAMAAMTNSALILPSTVAGILGYIIGSTIGCGVYKFIA